METVGDISVWLTPAITIGLFVWLRADIRALEERFEKRFDGMDKRFDGTGKRLDDLDARLRALEAGQAEIKGQLSFVRDYVLGRDLQAPETGSGAAAGD